MLVFINDTVRGFETAENNLLNPIKTLNWIFKLTLSEYQIETNLK